MNKEQTGEELDNRPGREAVLAMGGATFRRLGHRLVDQVAEFLESLPLMTLHSNLRQPARNERWSCCSGVRRTLCVGARLEEYWFCRRERPLQWRVLRFVIH